MALSYFYSSDFFDYPPVFVFFRISLFWRVIRFQSMFLSLKHFLLLMPHLILILTTSGQYQTSNIHNQPVNSVQRKYCMIFFFIAFHKRTCNSDFFSFILIFKPVTSSFPSQTLSQSMRQADLNFEKLKTESERLEQHTKKSVNWLLWLMLILVSFIFISMILFIRIFPRLRWWLSTVLNS